MTSVLTPHARRRCAWVFFGVLLAFALAPNRLAAQEARPYTLSGLVLDADTDEPLPGANVGIEGTSIGAAADVSGAFTLEATLEPGTYDVRATFIGYRPVSQTVTLGEEATVALEPFLLEEDVIRTDEVVVTGTGAPTERRQLGNAISTVNARDLAETGASAIDQALSGKIAGALVQ